MQIFFKKNKKTLTAKINGELDHHGAKNVRTEIDSYINENNIDLLILDLSGMTFMDSSGIGSIIGRYKLINDLGGKMAIVGVSSQTDKLLEISGIKKIIPIYNNADTAITRLGGNNIE